MLFKLTAVGFQGRMRTGKTRPLLLACANDEGNELDVVVKLSHHMERKVVGLIAETIASMFARDLGLQTPDPYLVALDPKFIATVPDVGAKTALNSSCPVTFGSGLFPSGLSIRAAPSHPGRPDQCTCHMPVASWSVGRTT